jgi:hypothetical protein
MKHIKTLLLAMLFTNTSYCQKSKTIYIGAVSDFPISKKLNYDFGIGVEATLLLNYSNLKNFTLSLSAQRLQVKNYIYQGLNADYKLVTGYVPFVRVNVGKLYKVTNKLFFNAQVGFGLGKIANSQLSEIQPTFLLGPAVILPIKEKYCVKLHSSLGAFGSAFFVNMGAAFGFKF